MKKCSKCGKIKPISDFWNSKRYRDKKYPSCKECQRKTTRAWEKANKEYLKQYRKEANAKPQRIYTRLKHKAKCTRKEFIDWFNSQPQECHYCKIKKEDMPKQNDSQLKRFHKTLSIDRKDNNRGYELGNMVLACIRCNFIKGDFFTYKEMLEIGEKYVKPKRN